MIRIILCQKPADTVKKKNDLSSSHIFITFYELDLISSSKASVVI